MNKKLIIVFLLFAIMGSITAVSAVENITVDSDSSIEGEVEMPTERLEIKFNDDDQTLNYKVYDERLYSGLTEKLNYDYKVNNKTRSCGQGSIYSPTETRYAHTLNYYEDGEHSLTIFKNNYGTKTLLFNVSFAIENNTSLSDDITIQHTKTVKYTIKNGVIPSKSGTDNWVTLKDGWNNLTEYSLLGSGMGDTKPVILKIYYRGYIVDGIDIRNKTTLTVWDDTYSISRYDNSSARRISSKSWAYNSDEIKLSNQVSWDGLYNYQYKSTITVPTTVKEPIYKWKKVKNGYKLKYYKTKWYKTKIVTHKWKKGKLIVYNNQIRKVKNYLKKNGKITKTVYSSKKTTVYIKYPVKYYKKVQKYKQKRYISGYKTVTKDTIKEIWVDAKGTPEQITFR